MRKWKVRKLTLRTRLITSWSKVVSKLVCIFVWGHMDLWKDVIQRIPTRTILLLELDLSLFEHPVSTQIDVVLNEMHNWFHDNPTPQIDSMSMAPSMGRGLNYETGSTNTNGSDSSQSHLITTTPSIVGSSNGYQQASVHRQPSQPINGSVIDGGMGSRARSK